VACEDKDTQAESRSTQVAAPVQTNTAATNRLDPEPTPAPEPAARVQEKNTEEKSEPAKSSSTLTRSQCEVTAAEDGQPYVKRLVIASAVQEREPVELENGKVAEPILAFVELKNLSESEAGVIVTFEHESGKKVGYVELSVPAESNRYRTWARTHNIQEPGTWTAVVKSQTGEELARKSFTVSS
jgi:hypothetical protein